MSHLNVKNEQYREETEGFFYYSAIATNNNESTPIEMRYEDTSSIPLLQEQERWKLCVPRFEIPAIPWLFPWESSKYYVSFSYGGSTYTTELIYVSWDSTQTDKITNYQQLCDMVNTAMATSFTLLKAGSGSALTQTNPPKLIFDASIQLFALKADVDWSTATAGTLLWSKALGERLPSFQSKFLGYTPAATSYEMQIYNTGDNVEGSYVFMYQQSQQLGALNQIAGLVILTNLNVRAESLPFANNANLNVSSNNFRRILCDFHITYNVGIEPMASIVNEYVFNINEIDAKSISIIGQGSFSNINMQIMWYDHNRNLYPMYLYPGRTFSVKLLFTRKHFL